MAPTVKAFESRLDKFWKNEPVLFNYKEELRHLIQRSGHRGPCPASRQLR